MWKFRSKLMLWSILNKAFNSVYFHIISSYADLLFRWPFPPIVFKYIQNYFSVLWCRLAKQDQWRLHFCSGEWKYRNYSILPLFLMLLYYISAVWMTMWEVCISRKSCKCNQNTPRTPIFMPSFTFSSGPDWTLWQANSPPPGLMLDPSSKQIHCDRLNKKNFLN